MLLVLSNFIKKSDYSEVKGVNVSFTHFTGFGTIQQYWQTFTFKQLNDGLF